MTGPQTREYSRLANGDDVRVRFTTDRGRVTMFTVQLEVHFEGRDWPAVRNDSAHGRPHRDTLDWAGHTVAKDWLPAPFDTDLNAALTYAVEDVVMFASEYRDAFVRRRP